MRTASGSAAVRRRSTRCDLRPASCGGRRHPLETVCTSTCGRTTLNARDRKAGVAEIDARLADLPPLPRDDDGPVFAEPWQAQAFALAVKLSEQGHFTWKEWSSALADEIKAAADRGELDDGSR